MRASRLLLIALGLTLLTPLAPPASAAPPPTAMTQGIVIPDADGYARVAVTCRGTAPPADVIRTVVKCDIYDNSGRPSIHDERSWVVGAGLCIVHGFALVMPVEYCTTTVATYRDFSVQTAEHCGHAGGEPPPRTPPAPHVPAHHSCFDPLNLV